jgi:hypothetical protein
MVEVLRKPVFILYHKEVVYPLRETVDDFLLYFACGMFLLMVQE